MTTLHDLARYYRNAGLVGEDRAAIASTIALAGGKSVIWRGYPGTAKTVGADITVELIPAEILTRVDMVSKLGIWSKDMADRIRAARIVYFPEDQNASDNDEVVKVKKKWGDGKPAERAKSEDFGNATGIEELPARAFVSTAAITNEAHERTFDIESARRVVKVNTDPSQKKTDSVLASKADVLVRGLLNTRSMKPLEAAGLRNHVSRVMLAQADAITGVRFFGAHELLGAVPSQFPEARSAFALFEGILLGVGRWYGDDEVRVEHEVFLSPQRVAETWAFYGDILVENALKWETSDREILSALPSPQFNGEGVPAPESCKDIAYIMSKLKPYGLTDSALVRRQLGKLTMKGFLAEAEMSTRKKWHRTGLSDVANFIDWAAVIKACRRHAPEQLTGEALTAYLAKCDAASGPRAIQNPITGEWGPLLGDKSVLYHDAHTGHYAPVGAPPKPTGILAF